MKEKTKKILKWSTIILISILILFVVIKNALSDSFTPFCRSNYINMSTNTSIVGFGTQKAISVNDSKIWIRGSDNHIQEFTLDFKNVSGDFIASTIVNSIVNNGSMLIMGGANTGLWEYYYNGTPRSAVAIHTVVAGNLFYNITDYFLIGNDNKLYILNNTLGGYFDAVFDLGFNTTGGYYFNNSIYFIRSTGIYLWNYTSLSNQNISVNPYGDYINDPIDIGFSANNYSYVVYSSNPYINIFKFGTSLINYSAIGVSSVFTKDTSCNSFNISLSSAGSENITLDLPIRLPYTTDLSYSCGGYSTNESVRNYYYTNTSQTTCRITFNFTNLAIKNFNLFTLPQYANGFISNDNNFTSPIYSSSISNFTLNLNYSSAYYLSISAFLNYNGTLYAGTKQGTGDRINFTANIQSLIVSTQTNITFFWNVTLQDPYLGNQYFNSLYNNQTVNPVPAGSFNISKTSCQETAINFTLLDEENLNTTLTGTINYNIDYSIGLGNSTNIFGQLTTTSNLYVCINSTISPNWRILSGELDYSSPTYVNRIYYFFGNSTLTNQTQNTTLFNLLSSRSISFQIIAKDNSLIPYVNKYITLNRWYPNLNVYHTVDMGKTDTTGATLVHVRLEEVQYRLGLYETSGSLIYFDNPINFYCSVLPCQKTLIVASSSYDISSILKIQYTFTYNETTKIWTFVYNDPSQKTSTMNMTIWDDSGLTSQAVCSGTTSGYFGVITCDTSAFNTGTLRGEVYRLASPPQFLDQLVINIASSIFQSNNFGSFIVMFLVIALVMLFAYISPTFAWAGTSVIMIIPLYLNIINWEIYAGFIVFSIVISLILKRVS